MRTLFHGSIDKITRPRFGFGKRNNDYGMGFYCTEAEDLAKEWAVSKDHDGWANRYEIDDAELNILDLGERKYCVLHWLAVLLENRQFETEYGLASEAKKYLIDNFSVPYKEADVVIGYRADDSYFAFAQDFISGVISYSQLSRAMRLGRLGNQYVLKSERAFDALKYIDSIPAKREDWLRSKEVRDLAARTEYLKRLRRERMPGDLRIFTIIDEGIKSNDKRLR